MYFNFFHLRAIFLFYYSTFFFSLPKFLLKFFPGFLMISPYYQLLMIYSQLATYTILQLASQLIKGQIRKMLSSKSKYQSQRKKKGVATQLFRRNLFYFPYCSTQFRILSTFVTNGILQECTPNANYCDEQVGICEVACWHVQYNKRSFKANTNSVQCTHTCSYSVAATFVIHIRISWYIRECQQKGFATLSIFWPLKGWVE